jgi:hypothetical protein
MSWQPAAVDELTRQLDRLFGCGIGAAVRLDAEAMLRKALPLIEVTPGMEIAGIDAYKNGPSFTKIVNAGKAMLTHCAKEKTP